MGSRIEVVREVAEEFHRLHGIIENHQEDIRTQSIMLKLCYLNTHDMELPSWDELVELDNDGYYYDWFTSVLSDAKGVRGDTIK